MDRLLHQRYLDYREMFTYFGRKITILTAAEFGAADEELRVLVRKGKARDASEDERKSELEKLLFRD
jgi:hypothetical protein